MRLRRKFLEMYSHKVMKEEICEMNFLKKIYRYVHGIKSVLVNGSLKLSKMARENALIAICLVTAVKIFDFFKRGKARKEIELAMDTFVSEEADKKCLSRIKRDIWKSRELYLVNSNEYFLFGFELLPFPINNVPFLSLVSCCLCKISANSSFDFFAHEAFILLLYSIGFVLFL